MTEKYKVGDLIVSLNGPQHTDIAEIMCISGNDVTYRWLGLHGMPVYDFSMNIPFFEKVFEEGMKIIPCDSEQQKLATILKYS